MSHWNRETQSHDKGKSPRKENPLKAREETWKTIVPKAKSADPFKKAVAEKGKPLWACQYWTSIQTRTETAPHTRLTLRKKKGVVVGAVFDLCFAIGRL